MKTISVLSRKGGVGKTTVAVNLALAARAAGLRVVLADTDPLRSCAEILRGRDEVGSLLVETQAAKLFNVRQACQRTGCDLLVVDTPTAPEADLVAAANIADISLVVTRPSFLDAAAVRSTISLLQRLGRRGLLVMNQCPSQRGGQESSTVARHAEELRRCGMPLTATALRARVLYQQAFSRSRAVKEMDPRGIAAAEVDALLSEVMAGISVSRQLSPANDRLGSILAGAR